MPKLSSPRSPMITLLESLDWVDYELLDSGDSRKLERFGAYTFVRPEIQAMWRPCSPVSVWEAADAVFQPTGEESGGHWHFEHKIPSRWQMGYGDLRFWVQTTPGRHLGLFPEAAAHWDWFTRLIKEASRPVRVLNLFGYTGLATLVAAAAGATVTHVDASKKAVSWARQNQALSSLGEKPIRWLVDDALKFVRREMRRGNTYDGLVLDPPKFGRGPKGEVWEVYKSLPTLLQACRAILSAQPLFVVLTVYAVKASALHIYTALGEMMGGCNGALDCGELVTREASAGRLLSQAVYARWQST
jgi:23S rRNA (cytosine1962-C5)-methyltransferase